MAFKGYGVGDFARVVNGIEVRRAGTVTDNSGRARVIVDGVEFTPKRKLFAGTPTKAMIAANNLNISTLEGRPWPGSAADRLAMSPPDKAARIRPDGEPIHLNGPNSMAEAQKDGRWPTERERQLQAQAEAKLAHPVEYAERAFILQGMTPERAKLRAVAAANGDTNTMMDVSDLLPKPPEADASVSRRKAG